MKNMMDMKVIHARNFAVFVSIGFFLLIGMVSIKSYLNFVGQSALAVGFLISFLKLFLKFLPLLAALFAEYFLSAREHFSLWKFTGWNKTILIDLYCFTLNNFHNLMSWLNIAFTFGIAYFFDQFITKSIPEEFKLFSIIDKHAGFTVAIVCFILIVSFFAYWEHRIWHSKLFWPIHRFHHSATDFNALTNNRNHFTEVLLTPLFFTFPVSLLGAPLEFFFYYLAFIQYQGFMIHIDEEVSYGWIGRNIWADPVFHKIHHSNAPEHLNKNFSGTLTLWDKLFGTFARYDERPISIGVTDGEHYGRLSYGRIYFKDFFDFLSNLWFFVRKLVIRRTDSVA